MKENKKKKKYTKPLILIVFVLATILAINYFDFTRFLRLDYIQSQLNVFIYQLEQNFLLFSLAFFVLYILSTSLSIPGASLLTLLAGALFGLVWGTVIVSFASTIGATISFLVSRYFLKESIENRFRNQFEKINEGIHKEGLLYLFALRLVPIFPFFIINLIMGITQIKTFRYMLISQIGMLPGTIIYINAGRSLTEITSTSGIFSIDVWLSFILLAILPLFSKRIIRLIRNRKIYKKYAQEKLRKYDANLIVIGAGSGGLISAYIAASLKAKVILIEKNLMGGDCLNTGCVPSKALINTSKLATTYKKIANLGLHGKAPSVSFEHVMKSVQQKIAAVAPHDSIDRYEALGVQCVQGEATIISPWKVQVGKKIYTTKSIIIATGANPIIPSIKGLSKNSKQILHSDNVWNLTTQPKNLVVVGGGPIGCELAQAFSNLGSKVHLVQKSDRLLDRDDPEVGEFAQKILQKCGVTVHLNTDILNVESSGKQHIMNITNRETKQHEKLIYHKILFAVGRAANSNSCIGENISLDISKKNTIETNQFLQTNIPNIFAVGDVVGPYQFTHISSHMAWYAVVNALLGFIKMVKINYDIVPKVTFLSPEIGHVGINEIEANAQDIAYEVTKYEMSELDRAIADNNTDGYIKIITELNKDKILGATVVAERGGELLTHFVMAMKHNIGLNKLLGTIFPYPTYAESVKGVAGVWKRNHLPVKVLHILRKIFEVFRTTF